MIKEIRDLKNYEDFCDYFDIYEKIISNSFDIIQHAFFSEKKYIRIEVEKHENCELLMLCWSVNQEAIYHDHDKSECLMSCIYGSIDEYTVKDKNEIIKHLAVSDIVPIREKERHRIKNNSNDKTFSLHLYFPPILECNTFKDMSFKDCRKKTVTIDSKLEGLSIS